MSWENPQAVMSAYRHNPDAVGMDALAVVLIGPHEQRRQGLMDALAGQARVTRELASYPGIDDLSALEASYDVAIVDLDTDPEQGLDLVEAACGQDKGVTVIACSRRSDPELLVRCMRAGAREFLSDPVLGTSVAEALVRASARRQEISRRKKTGGKLLLFVGAKGGSGVTTVASNFAVALARESGNRVVFADLNLQLGDAALSLGVESQFSTLDALKNASRLDSEFMSTLLVKHGSGLFVLPAPDQYAPAAPPLEGVDTLLAVLRSDFAYVVVDGGSTHGALCRQLLAPADTVYLVAQVTIPELRNANRFLNAGVSPGLTDKLQVVLNRFTSRALEIDEQSITKALTQPARWRIPNDFSTVRQAVNAGEALALKNSTIARAIAEMAREACGKPPEKKKKRFGLFG